MDAQPKAKEVDKMSKQTQSVAFDWSQYILLEPKQSERTEKTICIMQDSEVRLGSRLMKEIDVNVQRYIAVGLRKEEKKIAIKLEASKGEGTAYLKNNGCFFLKNAVEQLKSCGIKAPACFVVIEHPEEDIWVATYDAGHCFPVPKVSEKVLKRPRKKIPKEVFVE